MAAKAIPNVGIEEPLDPEEQAGLDAEAEGQEGIQGNEPFQPAPEGDVSHETPTESAAPAPDGKPQKQKKPSESVPFDRFKEVNEDLKAERQRAAELQEKWARLEERARIAREADERVRAAAQQPQGPARPDETVDPIGAALWDRDRKIEALERAAQQIQQGLGQTQQTVQQQAQFNEFSGWLNSDVARHRMQDPEYDQAAAFAQNRMLEWGRSIGAPEAEVQRVVSELTLWAAANARQNGQSAAAGFRRLADAMGYQSQAQPNPEPNGNGQPQPQQRQAQPTPAEVAKIKLEQARKGQSHQGLSRVPQEREETKNWTTMTAVDAAEYPEDKFAEDMNDAAKRRQWMEFFSRLEGVQ